jgi:leucyl aminopeptidase (aminopeptidase T)
LKVVIPSTIILNSRILLEFEQGEVCKIEREEEERVVGRIEGNMEDE